MPSRTGCAVPLGLGLREVAAIRESAADLPTPRIRQGFPTFRPCVLSQEQRRIHLGATVLASLAITLWKKSPVAAWASFIARGR